MMAAAMQYANRLLPLLLLAGAVAPIAGYAQKAPAPLLGVACETPPPMHCPDADCPGPLIVEQGNAVEPKTGRKFFLDYPCDLKPNEKVTFILSLHGAGSYGNWQRHYFPLVDFKDKYRLVIATPNAPPQVWAATDDEYLQSIVSLVYDQVGRSNIKAFWLVGHSQGGMTSNRLLRTEFFHHKVDGWLSLSGGRLGGSPGRSGSFGPPRATAAPVAAAGGIASMMAALRELPGNDFSFIYETGQHEMDDKGLPETSAWAEKYACGARERRPDVTDAKPGYVFDTRPQEHPNPAWGLKPRGGTAEVFVYPGCKDGRVVADVVRLDKGHTEGLEPRISEQLIQLMLSAKK
jgi:hypothetical protein